ncbi:hypothetical protein ACM7Q1_02790 [Paenibacillus illinoisensis]|uniref:hypothetical protein n=1 Tax=Paenibacillus illinoisensis TaxID=59845 RepID=UPI003A4DF3E5
MRFASQILNYIIQYTHLNQLYSGTKTKLWHIGQKFIEANPDDIIIQRSMDVAETAVKE